MAITEDHIEKIYAVFRKAQADHFNRGFRLPKNFKDHFNKKFKEQNKKKLIKITGNFLTKWQNIDPYLYFRCGFDIFGKNFSYMKFLNEKILLLYIRRDKNNKREVRVTKQNIIESAKFVKGYMRDNDIRTLDDYIHERVGNRKTAIDHYVKGKIDASFLVFLIGKGMILNDYDRCDLPYIQTNFRKLKFQLEDIKDFLKQMERKL